MCFSVDCFFGVCMPCQIRTNTNDSFCPRNRFNFGREWNSVDFLPATEDDLT